MSDPTMRWTEAELTCEISRLGKRIEQVESGEDERSRNAASYLQQVLQDRKRTLAILKQRRFGPV